MSAPVTVHVGLPKTGTTFLQTRAFPRIRGVRYLHKPAPRRLDGLADSERPVLVSKEGWLIQTDRGGVRSDLIEDIAARVPGARPMLILRRQDRWARSLYAWRLFMSEAGDFDDYIASKGPLYYTAFWDLLRESFGREPIVAFQEELRDAPRDTAAWLAEAAGGELDPARVRLGRVNPSRSERGLRLMRAFNRRFPKRPHKGALGQPRKKGRQLLLHLAGWAGDHLGERWTDHLEPAIPAGRLERIRELYDEDWRTVLGRVRAQRELLSPALIAELEGAE